MLLKYCADLEDVDIIVLEYCHKILGVDDESRTKSIVLGDERLTRQQAVRLIFPTMSRSRGYAKFAKLMSYYGYTEKKHFFTPIEVELLKKKASKM